MNELINVFTGGDIFKMIVFLIGILVLGGFGLCIIIIAKKYGIRIKLFGNHGKDIFEYTDENKQFQNMVDKSYNRPSILVKPIEETKLDLEELQIQKVQDFSKQKWEEIIELDSKEKTSHAKILEKKELIIEKLSQKNAELRKEIQTLNEQLKKYKLEEAPEILAFRNILQDLEESYVSEIKSICLFEKIIEKVTPDTVEQIAKDVTNKILHKLGIVIQSLYDSDFLPSNDYFINEFININHLEYSIEFSFILSQMKDVQTQYKSEILEKKTAIDKKILNISNSFNYEIWTKLFGDKNLDELTLQKRRKKCKNDYAYFRDEIWNTTLLHRMIYGVGVSMIEVFEQAKSETLDKDIDLSLHFFEILKKEYEKEIKSFVFKKYSPSDSIKASDINFEKNNNDKSITESDIIKSQAKNIFDIEHLEE